MSKTKVEGAKPPNGSAVATADLDPDDAPLNLSEVARICGKTQPTIKRWILDGLLKPIRMPTGLYAVRKSELMKFLGASALQPKGE